MDFKECSCESHTPMVVFTVVLLEWNKKLDYLGSPVSSLNFGSLVQFLILKNSGLRQDPQCPGSFNSLCSIIYIEFAVDISGVGFDRMR